MKATRNVHIYQSPFTHESRILKITGSLATAGLFDEIVVLATWAPGLPRTERIDGRRLVLRLGGSGRMRGGSARRAVFVLGWQLRAMANLLRTPPDCLSCHSLSLLP